jgi:hypothetical protein
MLLQSSVNSYPNGSNLTLANLSQLGYFTDHI